MYLSCLLIDLGDNPDRPRPGRLWLRNRYHVHQRLCMAFPSDARKQRDPHFLAPYAPDDFPEQRHVANKKKTEIDPYVLEQVHTKRGPASGFLFRVDPQLAGRAVILVQSASRPDWQYAFQNAWCLLAALPEVKPLDPCFTKGEGLQFRLDANPTRRLSKHSLEADGRPIEEKWIGKRVPVPADSLFDWLGRRAERGGFFIREDSTTCQPGYVYVNKTSEGNRLLSVRYQGILNVTDPGRFRETVLQGIGPGKAFGFGLLSIARPSGDP